MNKELSELEDESVIKMLDRYYTEKRKDKIFYWTFSIFLLILSFLLLWMGVR